MKWTIGIERVVNGFVITGEREDTEGEICPFTIVIEENGELKDKMESQLALDLCWWIVDYFGLSGSKHDEHRIEIGIYDGGE